MKCNRFMSALLNSVNSGKSAVSSADREDIESVTDRLFSDVVYESGCLFMRTDNGKALPHNLDNDMDKVEFEAWHNEILINSEFGEGRVTAAFAMEFFTRFNERLAAVCPRKICSVMSEDDGRWTYRFHIVREGEPLWISEDLGKFSQPVLYEIFGGVK